MKKVFGIEDFKYLRRTKLKKKGNLFFYILETNLRIAAKFVHLRVLYERELKIELKKTSIFFFSDPGEVEIAGVLEIFNSSFALATEWELFRNSKFEPRVKPTHTRSHLFRRTIEELTRRLFVLSSKLSFRTRQ